MGKLIGSSWQFKNSILAQSLIFSLNLENLALDRDEAKKNHVAIPKTADLCLLFQANTDCYCLSESYFFGHNPIL